MSNLPKGTLVDHYVIERVVTQGGFAWAYFARKASDPEGPEYFLKELFNDQFVYRVGHNVQLLKPEYQKQWKVCQDGFIKELNVLSTLNIPNIPKVIDAFEANDTFYIVQEKVNGITLDKYFRQHIKNKGAHTNAHLLTVLIRLLQTLNSLHKFHKLHRDIKPSNILVDDNAQPYLVDFGAARLEIDSVTMNIQDRALTVGFSSFEQSSTTAEQMAQGPSSDIYSVGATMYFLLFNEKPVDAQVRVVKGEEVKDFVTLSKHYDKPLLETFNKAFRPLPHARYQDIDQWLAELAPIAKRLGVKYSSEVAEPEYHFEIGRKQGNDPNKHRILINSSPRVSGLHAEVSMITRANKTIEMTMTDRSSNGTYLIAQTDQGEINEKLVKDEPVSFLYSSDCIMRLADAQVPLRQLLVTYARETKASQIEKLINEIESGAQTQIMQQGPLSNFQEEPSKQANDKHQGNNQSADPVSPAPDDATGSMTWKQIFFSYKGEISRGTFWGALIIWSLISIPIQLAIFVGFHYVDTEIRDSSVENGLFLLLGCLTFALFVVSIRVVIAVYYKRLRHTGLSKGASAVWIGCLLLPFVSLVPLILAGFMPKDSFREYG